jgi:hypothetical protein
MSESLQKSAFEIAVNVFKRSNHQGKTCGEAYWRLRMAVYESCHVVARDRSLLSDLDGQGRACAIRA